jgi:exportin-1
MYHRSTEQNRFKVCTRDFLIQLREVSGVEDNADLYQDEAEAKKKAEEEAKRQLATHIPGLLPEDEHRRPDGDDDLQMVDEL